MVEANRNPFTPNFGSVPVWMAGRTRVIGDLLGALDQGVGNPNLCTLLSGDRGSGKTALLTYVSDHAREHGWVSVDVSAEAGMLEDIVQRTIESAQGFVRSSTTKVTSISVPALFSASWEHTAGFEPNWRTRMNALLDQLALADLGLVITVDEVNPEIGELVSLVSTYQHFVRERRNVALLMAGLPNNVSSLLGNDDVSFLRRASRRRLGNVSQAEAEVALRRTIEFGGKGIEGGDLSVAAQSTLGYPYLMQLVGYHLWEASAGRDTISTDDVRDGVLIAKGEFEERVLESTCRALSDGDRRFLVAMLPDEGESRIADIAARMGVTSNYASHYRRRLEEKGVVSTHRRGVVGVDLPLLKDYVARTMEE